MTTCAPQLSRIFVRCIGFQNLALPSVQLTSCNLELWNGVDLIELLRAAVNLVDCTIYLQDTPTTRDVVCHNKLEKLVIFAYHDYPRNRLVKVPEVPLDCWELPAVRERELQLDQPRSSDSWPIETFFSFLSRSGCTLSRLRILRGPPEEDFLRYLSEVPSLIELMVHVSPEGHCP